MIYVCGEALIDLLPVKTKDEKEAYQPFPGGSPFNTCIAASRLGIRTGFLGRISRDFLAGFSPGRF